MKKISLWMLVGVFLWSFSGCKDGKDDEASVYLSKARSLYNQQRYEDVQRVIDSIRIISPQSYPQIRAGEILSDSTLLKINQLRLDFLEEKISEYKRLIYLEEDRDDRIAIWSERIDSIQALKNIPKKIVQEIENKEALRMACNQCRTIMKQ